MTSRGSGRDGASAAVAFMASLDARDASPHTKRAYKTAVGQFLTWLEGVPSSDWTRPPRRTLRAYLAELDGRGLSRSTIGSRIALLGGIDLDFMCRNDEAAIRERVRDTLDICMDGGGYCLGTGNSVPEYVPDDHYFAMISAATECR